MTFMAKGLPVRRPRVACTAAPVEGNAVQSIAWQQLDLLRAGIAVEPTYKPAQENLALLGSRSECGAMLFGDEEDEGNR
jgi:hypothetical protein